MCLKNMLPFHSVLSLHFNEGKTFTKQLVIQNILQSSRTSDLFLLSNLSKFASFPFCHISSQFQDIEHENEWKWRGVGVKKERQS